MSGYSHLTAEERYRGITINGLAISDSDSGFPQYYLQNLVTGPASFVMEVRW
jgi:hypothetical protein